MSAPLKLLFSATGRTIWLRIFMLLLKYTNTAKHAVTQNSEKSKHITECNSSVFSIWIITESWNHRTPQVGRDSYIKTVYLLTQYIGTIAENYKEIISLETEFYYPNYSETLYLNKLIISDGANHTHH